MVPCFVSDRPGNAGAHKYCLLSGESHKKVPFYELPSLTDGLFYGIQ